MSGLLETVAAAEEKVANGALTYYFIGGGNTLWLSVRGRPREGEAHLKQLQPHL